MGHPEDYHFCNTNNKADKSRFWSSFNLVVSGRVKLDQYGDYDARDFVLLKPKVRLYTPPLPADLTDSEKRFARLENIVNILVG